MSSLLVFGAGGHGKVVADTAKCSGRWNDIYFVDNLCPDIRSVLEFPVIAPFSEAETLVKRYMCAAVGIGDNRVRLDWANKLIKLGFELPVIQHPSSVIAESAKIEDAVVLFANTVVQPDAYVGFASIINTSATIDHDCVISEGTHISPGVHLSGGVEVGSCSWIGIGASVIQNTKIGEYVTIGAGSCVISDVESFSIAVGVPAKVTRSRRGK